MSPRIQAAISASGFRSRTVTSFCVRPDFSRRPSRRKWEVEPNGVATFLPRRSAGALMPAAVRTTRSSAGPILSEMAMTS